ncbi:MAG: archease [Terriglobia bacterium]
MASEMFRILEHPADVGFEAYGASVAETFANAARALTSIRVDLEMIVLRESVTARAEGRDRESLLFNWLSEVLYLEDAEGWLFAKFEIEEMSDVAFHALARGEKYDPARHQLKSLVKAITYHQLAIEKTDCGWRAQVFVDI